MTFEFFTTNSTLLVKAKAAFYFLILSLERYRGKKGVEKLRSIAELRAFYGTFSHLPRFTVTPVTKLKQPFLNSFVHTGSYTDNLGNYLE
jgi:hypothetical protein